MSDDNTQSCFEDALSFAKIGHKITRANWNGKGMYVFLLDKHFITHGDSIIELEPCFVLKTATGHFQPGWLASQADMLSDDWLVLEKEDLVLEPTSILP